MGYRRAAFGGDVLVLHDVVLHHGRLAEFVRTNRPGHYRQLMTELYGDIGTRLSTDILRGWIPDDLSQFPLFEDFVRRARLTVVHSDYARSLVLRRVPEADVQVIPMGIPLPRLTAQNDERQLLGLPSSAFVIASITHVNPYKRIPIVLRALRRLIDRVPEALLIIAGSVAPGVDLQREIRLLNLERHVVVPGYVSDSVARSIARAADVCVNLRYPSAGETSASLLRMLGAGRPVIVTDDLPMAEYPRSAVLPVPADRFEAEFLAELLLLLATDTGVRIAAGDAAREFVRCDHSMHAAVSGYSDAIEAAFGLRMPQVNQVELHQSERLPEPVEIDSACQLTSIDAAVVEAVGYLRIVDHDATMLRVAGRLRELQLDRAPLAPKEGYVVNDTSPIRQELLEILRCPVCFSVVKLRGNTLVCEGCGRRYRIDDGVPVMLADEAE